MSETLRDNPEKSRYEVLDDDTVVGFSAYRLKGERISFTHIEVDDSVEGRGFGSKLARAALDDSRQRGLEVLPFCPFIRGYIARHDEYLDLVPESERARFELTGA